MTSHEIRQSFLDFFAEKKHTIVPSASLLPDSPNLLFTNAGMNQFVPIFLGERSCPYQPARAADTQKCIRAGGKHNDLEDVGFDTYHHTFFEMLGNWSFGDYFKAEAIRWAWELVVGRWGFPPSRLYATVYRPGPGDPSTFDAEAHEHWAALFAAAGLDPGVHVVSGGRKENFWMMGDTGPCGPCSELHVDLTPGGDSSGRLVNAGDPACIEIWNLVFIQFNAEPDGSFSPLPARHVDTGMGFERVASILQGTRGFTLFDPTRISNYETDIFRPLFDEIETLSGRRYTSSLPGRTGDAAREAGDVAFRVIADHARALGFAVADGILPGNTDRNYVLRRILRRAVRYGRTLGFREPFFYKLADVLSRTMGDVFPELRARNRHVQEVLHMEEEAFNRTLDKGIALFEAEAARGVQAISGAFAFRLYDEQGFPLDLTALMARERGLSVDTAGFDELMEAQRAKARAAQKKQIIEVSKLETRLPTGFVGFEELEADAAVLELVSVKGRAAAVLDRSPFYAEMGGQVGDSGLLSHGPKTWAIADTRKSGAVWLHILEDGDDLPPTGSRVAAIVDRERRLAIERHHTATHLLHWAVHEVVSHDASQKGSFVGPAKLTFDFNSAPLSPSQISDVERLVNERILENAPVRWMEVPYDEVRDRRDVMQLFGEKYGSRVRVVQIAGEPGRLNGYSMELCGGTHVRSTGEIGLFRLVGESAIAAGVRRVEALAGLEAFRLAAHDAARLEAIAAALHCPLGEIERRIEATLEHARRLEKSLEAAARREAAAEAARLASSHETLGGIPAVIASIPEADADRLQRIADALKASHVVFLAGGSAHTVALVAAVPKEFATRVSAGQLVSLAAPLVGGKGGGKPEAARGGGKNPAGIPAALEAVRRHLAG